MNSQALCTLAHCPALMKRTNILPFTRRSRRATRPAGPRLINTRTAAGQIQRLALFNARAADWLAAVLNQQTATRDVRCVPIGRDFVVTLSAPLLRMAKVAPADKERKQLA